MLTKEDVIWAYRLFLGREPENNDVVQSSLKSLVSREQLVQSFMSSEEYKNKYAKTYTKQPSPFWHYLSAFDAVGTINKYAKPDLQPSPYYATNFLGVKMRLEFYPKILPALIGKVEPPPIPTNWHADIAEWASCLRSVDLSGQRFVMLELGCGWGCWINNLGVAAKSEGKSVKLYGVEADQQSLRFARLALNDNGITENEFFLSKGIAGKMGNVALFPSESPEEGGGGVAIFNPSNDQLNEAKESSKYVIMPSVDIDNLIKNEKLLNFMHVDIQGAELDLLTEIFDLLCKKVRYIFIGTHSKQIEAGLFDLFMSNGLWKLEMERPAIFLLSDGRPVIQCDGVQTWRNSAFD